MNTTDIAKELREAAETVKRGGWPKYFTIETLAAAADIVEDYDKVKDWQSIKVTKEGETHPLGTLIGLLETERDALKAEVDSLETDNRHLENLYAMAQTNIDLLTSEIKEMTGKRDALVKDWKTEASRCQDAITQRGTLAAENERLKSERENWRVSSVCRELEEKIATLEARHAAVMVHTQMVVDENARLREALQRIAEYQGRFAEDDPQSIATEALKL